MSPKEALEVLRQAAELALLSKKDHVVAEQAYQLLKKLVEEKCAE